MKKILATVMLGIMAIAFITGCAKKEHCMVCGETENCEKQVIMGEELFLCVDCKIEVFSNFNDVNFYDNDEQLDKAIDNKKTLDVFQGIELIYSGANGAGAVSFDNYLKETEFEVDGFYFKPLNETEQEFRYLYGFPALKVIYDNEVLCYVEYDINISSYDKILKKGDKVVVTAEIKNPSDAFAELEYTPLLQKEFVVPDLGEYLTEKKDFTTDLINRIETKLLSKGSNVSFGEKAESVTIEKAYFAKANPGTEIPGKSKISLISIVKRDSKYYVGNVYDIYTRDENINFSVKYYYDDSVWKWVYTFETLEEAENELDNIINNEYTYEEIA